MSTEPQAGTPEYAKLHALCPRCFSGSHEQTTAGYLLGYDSNRSICQDCGWKGIVHDRVSKEAEDAERRIAADLLEQHGFYGAARVMKALLDGRAVLAWLTGGADGIEDVQRQLAAANARVAEIRRQIDAKTESRIRSRLLAAGIALPSDAQ